MDPYILKVLKEHDLIEKEQIKTGHHIDDLPDNAVNKDSFDKDNRILNNYFFRSRDVYISKHDRFADYPTHSHKFLEMNYMLNGSCEEIVNGKTVHLNRGDLLLLDVGSSHSIKRLNENDILINILFRDKSISINLLNDMRRSNSILYDFLIKRASGEKNALKYILFRNDVKNDINKTMEDILNEYYSKNEFSNSIIKSYLSILLTKLVRHYHVPSDAKNPQQQLIIKILKEISEDYKVVSLSSLARKYGYNRNYLSNFIKSQTGETFSSLLLSQRMIRAHNLVISTDVPIDDIILNIGMKNKTDFYKKYKNFYKTLPNNERKKVFKENSLDI